MNHKNRTRRAAAMIAALGIIVEPSAHLIVLASGQAQPAPQATPAPGKTPAPSGKPPLAVVAASTTPVDGGWPRLYDLASGGSILVYQPQVASWDQKSHLVAFSSVSLRNKAGDKRALGTIKLEADTKVAVADRLVSFKRMKIAEANFQTLPREQVREITDAIVKAIPDDER